MPRPGVVMRKLLLSMLAALALAPAAAAAVKPVPSLTPKATHALWLKEVAAAKTRPRALRDTACRPGRAIFYAQTDWLRLTTKLAAQNSPCVQYYVSVPPLAADKTQARPNQAAQIRALGSNFHALDEVSWNGWNAWVTAGNGTWYDAGVTARQRMAAAGFDAAAGDTWALNELSSAVRTGTGTARANALEFMRGLASDGVKGVVFVQGMSQTVSDTGTYKVNLQNWLQDAGFWGAVSQYASDWAQENYGDVRAYAVAGASADQRRDAEVQYLGHELALANAGPDAVAAARTFLQGAYVPFGNGAWAWNSSYGFTNSSVATMQDFVSGQVYAARTIGDRVGFAWAPNNTQALATTDFNTQTASLLDRIAAAIRGSSVSPDAACAPSWCATAVDGAAFTSVWAGFTSWSNAGLVISSPPSTAAAGTPIQVTVQIQTAGVAQPSPVDQAVTFTTSSPGGAFASQTATIPAGASSATVTYTDTHAGSVTISASLAGQPAAVQTETVVPAALATLTATPPAATVPANRSATFRLTGADAYGNAVTPVATWTLSTTDYGRLTATSATTATFTAANRPGRATVTASANGVATSVTVTVTKSYAPRVAGVGTKSIAGHLIATARVVRGAAPVAGIALTMRVRKGSSIVAVVHGKTDRRGRLVWRSRAKLPRARYVATALLRSASTAARTQHP